MNGQLDFDARDVFFLDQLAHDGPKLAGFDGRISIILKEDGNEWVVGFNGGEMLPRHPTVLSDVCGENVSGHVDLI